MNQTAIDEVDTELDVLIDAMKKNAPPEISRSAAIARRAAKELAIDYTFVHFTVLTVNAHVGLRLDDLLAADGVPFAHDVYGMVVHLDRKTGNLSDCFRPRFAISDIAVN